ncbi:polysaccharide pyruvyl transferase family protein [Agrococcus citreus]|uniref:Polysaccharide pyruvyl transferase domain-containing protein n=1 Tax=Agrococcus citreus TaxID=84643 RepID=A0ABN1YLJ7_9MICO
MRVLVGWADDSSPNLGVRALGEGSVDLLRRVWPEAEFTFMNYRRRPQEIPWGRDRSLLRERVTGRAGMMRWLAGFDLVWDTRSGDSFADLYGLPRHTTMSLVHEFAVQAGTPVALAPQTIGPFRTVRGGLLARRSLRRSRFVFARDPRSAREAARLGRPVDGTTSDLVFGLRQPTARSEHDVLLNVSGLLWHGNDHVDATGYRSAVRGVIDGLLSDGRAVTLLPHVLDSEHSDDDVPASRALAAEFDGRIGLHVPLDLSDARAAVAGARLVIGARMHACLNALSTGTPAVAMAYSRKFAPLMDSIGWQHVVQLSGSGDVAAAVLAHARGEGLADEAVAAQERGQRMLDVVVERLAGA